MGDPVAKDAALAWRKSPPELIALFDTALPDDARIERRKMFGYPCAFLNGNMFTGLHQEDCVVRLSEADRDTAKQDLGAGVFEPMAGRPMREYMSLPEAVLSDDRALADWLARSLDYATSLPVKVKKPRKATKKKAAGKVKAIAKGKKT